VEMDLQWRWRRGALEWEVALYENLINDINDIQM